jgi:hypothetical protein
MRTQKEEEEEVSRLGGAGLLIDFQRDFQIK